MSYGFQHRIRDATFNDSIRHGVVRRVSVNPCGGVVPVSYLTVFWKGSNGRNGDCRVKGDETEKVKYVTNQYGRHVPLPPSSVKAFIFSTVVQQQRQVGPETDRERYREKSSRENAANQNCARRAEGITSACRPKRLAMIHIREHREVAVVHFEEIRVSEGSKKRNAEAEGECGSHQQRVKERVGVIDACRYL